MLRKLNDPLVKSLPTTYETIQRRQSEGLKWCVAKIDEGQRQGSYPAKGKWYWTKEEAQALVQELQSEVLVTFPVEGDIQEMRRLEDLIVPHVTHVFIGKGIVTARLPKENAEALIGQFESMVNQVNQMLSKD